MREKLNSNPMVQLGVVGVLAVVVGLIFMMNMGGGEGGDDAGSAPPPEPPPVGGTVDPSASAGVDPSADAGVTVDPATGGTTATAPIETPLGPPLPQPVRQAYAAGDTVVLLVVREGGIEDEAVAGAVEALRGEPGVATFIVPTGRIAAYSRITRGVGVTRAPALVVVRPRSMSDGVPDAQVHYGYREPATVLQAVRDASYRGQPATYGP